MNLSKLFAVLSLASLFCACADDNNVFGADDISSTSEIEYSSSDKDSGSEGMTNSSKGDSGSEGMTSSSKDDSGSESGVTSSSSVTLSGVEGSCSSMDSISSSSLQNDKMSSSMKTASSSSIYLPEGWSWEVPQSARLNPEIKYDTMIDPRDKRVYKIVKIAPEGKNYSQVWMAENLNYADSVRTPILKGNNWCYNDSAKYCEVSGRYYSWIAAIDSIALANDSKDPVNCGRDKRCGFNRRVQGICPDGWHLPTRDELGQLIVALGNSEIAGKHLKALTGWNKARTGDHNGVDDYGFSSLPTGKVTRFGELSNVGTNSYYWSSVEIDERAAHYMNINNIYTQAYMSHGNKNEKLTVRCVKNGIELSSSSVAESSSSYVSYLNPDVKYDSIVDSRDGHVYKTVKIGDLVWMAENLNYAGGANAQSLKDAIWCYGDRPQDCDTYGRLYSWTVAVDSVALATDPQNPQVCGYGKSCKFSGKVQGICPNGWHLPNNTEWEYLFTAVGGAEPSGGLAIKAKKGWGNPGNDKYGFSALPGGLRENSGRYLYRGSCGYFWSSTEASTIEAYGVFLGDHVSYATVSGAGEKNMGFSVRCVMDYSWTLEPVSSSSVAVSSSNSVRSSSSAESSSSDAKSSSSVVVSDAWNWNVPKEDYFNPEIKYDTMIDPRDNQVYKIVKVAPEGKKYSQVWMAENLNYADSTKTPVLKGQSWCFLDSAKYCKLSGRYYTWMAAIDSVALAMDPDNPMECGRGKECAINDMARVQGICPDGWHLPTKDELGQLIVALGNSDVAGQKLKSMFGWGSSAEGRGTDAYGFTALPVGRGLSPEKFLKVGTDDYFWSSGEYSSLEAKYMNMNNIYSQAYMFQGYKYFGQNVRCVKN